LAVARKSISDRSIAMAFSPGAKLAVALAFLVGSAAAEVFKVTKEDVPAYTLSAKHLFYVDASPPGGHKGGHGAGLVREEDSAEVVFEDLRVTKATLGSNKEQSVGNVQVGILPWVDFDALLEKTSFCTGEGDVFLKEHESKAHAKILKVPIGKTVTERMKITKTTVYVAFLSNCGSIDDLQISGTINVKGTNGYIPGNRQSAMTLFAVCLVLHIIAGLAWVFVLASNKSSLHEPHYAIASFIVFGIGEAVGYWQYLSVMGDTGEASVLLEKLCQSMSIMKSAYMFAVIMLLCFGVGLTQAEEYSNISWKLLGVVTLFSAALAPKVCVFDYRHSKNLSDSDIVLAMIPIILVSLASLAWAVKGLSATMTRCKDLSYSETLKLLQRLVILVVMLMLVAAGILAAQVMDRPGRDVSHWSYHMFWNDIAGEMVHLIGLVSLMVLCMPNQATFKANAYAISQGEGGGVMVGAPCAQDEDEAGGVLDLDDIADAETGPAADTIGAPMQAAE